MWRSPLVPDGSVPAAPEPSTDLPATTALSPRPVEQLLRAKGDLRLGLPVILRNGDQALLVALVEALSAARRHALTGRGRAELVLSARRGAALGVRSAAGAGALRLPVPAGADGAWLARMAGQGAAASDAPTADAFPSAAAATEAQEAGLRLVTGMQVLPALLTVPLPPGAPPDGLTTLSVRTLQEALRQGAAQMPVGAARLPTDVSRAGRVHLFRPDDGGPEHCALEIGDPDPARPVLVRLHSACFTGDVLGSRRCDCGPQLRGAMAAMAAEGGGVLLYLAQEGRGIGLANKLRAYALQEAGLDTVEANHWLGFEDDPRDFRIGAQLLERLGVGRVRLLTNNPAKVEILRAHGIDVVERVPLRVPRTEQNARYLATKAAKSGHLL